MQNVHHRSQNLTNQQLIFSHEIPVLRVGSSSPVRGVAGSIAHALRENEQIVLRAIGAAAVNQAVKAVALARSYLAAEGVEIVVVPSMQDAEERGRAVVEMVVRRG